MKKIFICVVLFGLIFSLFVNVNEKVYHVTLN